MNLMKKTLISLLLFSSTMAFANNANLVDDNSCADIVKQAYEKSIERENSFLTSASNAIEDLGGSLAENFGNTSSCLQNAMNSSFSFAGGVPGMQQIMQQAMQQIDQQIASKCNSAVSKVKSSMQNSLGKYSTNQNLFKSDYFSGININSSIR